MRPKSLLYPLLAIFNGSRCKASLVVWLVWVVLLSVWRRVCIVEPFSVVSAVLASSSIKPIHFSGCILDFFLIFLLCVSIFVDVFLPDPKGHL
jgi:hypothetical protein